MLDEKPPYPNLVALTVLNVFRVTFMNFRYAVDNEGALDKESTSYDDILDALRLSLKSVEFGKPRH